MTPSEKRAEAVAAWRASGETAREFAETRGVSCATLKWWAREVRIASEKAASGKQTPAKPVALAHVVRQGERVSTGATVAVEVGSLRVVVCDGFNPKLLRDVVVALREGSL